MARRYTRPLTTPAASRIRRDHGRPLISLLSDWGARDPSPAICRGVMLGIAPDVMIVDISHEVEKYNISHGALLLWCALPYLPIGAHVAVIDPGVGTSRRAIALETARGDILVGPDNGLLLPGAERLGGALRCHLLENAQYLLPSVSGTFHGRDVFAPAAAHLALGLPLESIGRSLPVEQLVRLDWPAPNVMDGQLDTTVLYVDTFGNVKMSALAHDVRAAFEGLRVGDRLALRIGGRGGRRSRRSVTWSYTFGDAPAGELLLYEDSYGRLCLAQNQGNAAALLNLADGTPLHITGRPAPARSQDKGEQAAEAQAAGWEAAGVSTGVGGGGRNSPASDSPSAAVATRSRPRRLAT